MSGEAGHRITVYVDDRPRRLFLGLRVRHAIGHREARRVKLGEAAVEDDRGSRVELDGALYDGERLYVRRRAD